MTYDVDNDSFTNDSDIQALVKIEHQDSIKSFNNKITSKDSISSMDFFSNSSKNNIQKSI